MKNRSSGPAGRLSLSKLLLFPARTTASLLSNVAASVCSRISFCLLSTLELKWQLSDRLEKKLMCEKTASVSKTHRGSCVFVAEALLHKKADFRADFALVE